MLADVLIGITKGIIEVLLLFFPTKKNERIRQNLKLLNQEQWFLPFQDRLAFRYKASVRKLLAEVNYEEIKQDEQQLQQFKKELTQAFQ